MNTSSTDRTVKVPHLVMALLFAGTVAVWALVASDSVGTDQVAFLVPGVLVAAGVLGLLASVLSGRNRRTRPAPLPPLHDAPRHDPPRHEPAHDEPVSEHDDLEHTAPLTPTQPTPHRPEESR